MISWVGKGQLQEKSETRGTARENLVVCSMFPPEVFHMKDKVLLLTKAANKNLIGEVWQICLPESMVKEVWCLCHQRDLGGHRCLEGALKKFLKGFFMLLVRQKLRF